MVFPAKLAAWFRMRGATQEERRAVAKLKEELKACDADTESISSECTTSPQWRVSIPADTAALVSALPLLGLKGCHFSITKMCAPGAFQTLLTRWPEAKADGVHGAFGSDDPFTIEIPLSDENAARLADLIRDFSSRRFSRSISVHRRIGAKNRSRVLLSSGFGELEIDPSVSEQRIQEFSQKLSVTYRWHEEEWNGPRWRIEPTSDVTSFIRALPRFPMSSLELHILTARGQSPESPDAISRLLALAILRTGTEDLPEEIRNLDIGIPVTQTNMDAVADIFAKHDRGELFSRCFIEQGEKTIMHCGATGIDVYPALSRALMKAFCDPLGLEFRRVSFGAVGVLASICVSVTIGLWITVTRPRYAWACFKRLKRRNRRAKADALSRRAQ